MSAYVHSLRNAVRDFEFEQPRPPDLQTRFEAWFNGLPEFTRQRPFAMREFEVALGRPGRFISAVLLALGWERKRRWDSRGHYHRYWMPPSAVPK
jgi:hypothetical protein